MQIQTMMYGDDSHIITVSVVYAVILRVATWVFGVQV